MQKSFNTALALAFLAGFAVAGEVKTERAKCITISGEIELDNVTRSAFFGDMHRLGAVSPVHQNGGDLNFPPALIANNLRAFDLFDGRNSNSENFLDPEITLNFDIELVDNVRGFIQLENAQRDRYPVVPYGPLGFDAQGGRDQGFPFLGQGRTTQRAGDNNLSLDVEQAYIEFDSLLENLRMRTGITDIEYDLRGDGNAFFLDVSESEGIGPEITIPGIIGNFQLEQTQEFGGWTGTYTMADVVGGSLAIDGYLGTLSESGFLKQDRKLAGYMFNWALGTEDPDINNLVRFGNTFFNTDSSNWITNWVMGVDWNLVNVAGAGGNLELFWELVLQHGEFASAGTLETLYPQRFFEDHTDGLAAPEFRAESHVGSDILTQPAGAARSNDYLSPYSNDQEQKSWGTYFGFQYTQADMEWKPWVEFMYMYLSGDDGGYGGDPGKLFHANEDFVSFEDNDATLIVEENDYGLDIDDNYWKIQVAVGASLAPAFNGEADVNVKLLYAFFEMIDTPFTVRDNIGSEFDLIFTWNYSQDLSFTLGAAWLWDNETFVDLDEYSYLWPNSPLVQIDDHAFLLNLGTTLRF